MRKIFDLRGRMASVASAGCLAVLLGWGGAMAQGFQAVTGGYDATHSIGSSLNQWEATGGRGAWSVETVGGNTGAVARDLTNDGDGFLVLRTSAFACSNDGTYTVTLAPAEFHHALGTAAIVFRHSQSGFYALRIRHNYNTYYHPVLFSKGTTLNTGEPQTGEIALGTAFEVPDGQSITLTIELLGSRIKVFRNGEEIADFTDTSYPSGQVGYAQAANWTRGAVFVGSSWRNKEKSVPDGYLAWNPGGPGVDFAPANGEWLSASWSQATTATPLTQWISGRSAYFNVGVSPGNYSISVGGEATVDTMRFETNGFSILGATGGVLTSSRGQVIVPASVSGRVDAVIAGTNGLTLSGGGTLVIGGGSANTYSGATTISGASGTLVAGKSGAFGTSAITIGGGHTLRLDGVTLSNALAVNDNGNLISAGSGGSSLTGAVSTGSGAGAATITVNDPLSISGVISGARGLTKTGTAPLTLSGANSYSGVTTVSAGTLQIGAATGGSIAGPLSIASGATAIFGRSNDAVYNGVISGAGALVKQGTGTLTLGGANSAGHTGTTTVSGGAIEITSAGNLGSGALTVAAGSRLILNAASGTATFARAMEIAGTFEKSGAGTITSTSAMTVGTLDVSGGTLNLDGNVIADTIAVRGGARLSGTATQVGKATGAITVTNGTLVGKNYQGRVTLGGGGVLEQVTEGQIAITGSLTMNAGSRIEIGPTSAMRTGASPAIQASSALTLGGTLNFVKTPFTDADTGTYRIIGGTGGVTGTFSNITINGQDPAQVRYTATQTVSGNVVSVRIAKLITGEIVRNPLSVTGVELISDNETESVVRVTVSGFGELAGYMSGSGPAYVTAVHIWYKPGSNVTTGPDAIAAGGGRHTVAVPPAIVGNVTTFDITISGSADVRDTVFYFSASVDWMVDGGKQEIRPTDNASVYARFPKNAVLPNELSVGVVGSPVSAVTGLTFELVVTGQNSPQLTPIAPYKPRVDMIAVWIKRNGGPPSLSGNTLNAAATGSDSVMIFPIDYLRQNNGALTVNMARVPDGRIRDTIYFSVAPHWTGVGVDSIARPLNFVSQTVPNPTLPMPNDPVLLSAVQSNVRAPSVEISLGVSGAFNEHATNVRVELAFESSMSSIIDTKEFTVDQVAAGQIYDVTDNGFVGAERSVFYRITVLGPNGYVERTGSFTVGREPPLPPLNFTAEPLGRGAMMLRWTPVTTAGNNVGNVSLSTVTVVFSTGMISGSDDIRAMPGSITVPASQNEVRVPLSGELEPDTDYRFAAAFTDVVDPAMPSWNLTSDAVVITENTGPYNAVSNIIKIDTVIYREAAADFMIVFGLLFDNAEMIPYRYVYDVMLGLDTIVRIGEPAELRIFTESARDTVFTRSLGDVLMFDTTYRIHMYTIGADGNRASGRAIRDVAVGAFSAQTIVKGSGGTGFVNNGKFGITAPEWTYTFEACTTLIRRSDDIPEVEGLIYLGDFGYRYNVRAGGYVSIMEPFTIHMAAENVPPPYTLDDVRIYRWTGSFWEVLYDTRYEDGYFKATAGGKVEDDTTSTYRLLINTQRPVVMLGSVTISGGSASLPTVTNVNRDIDDTNFRIMSPIGNFQAKLVSASANNSPLTAAREINNPPYARVREFQFRIDQNIVVNSENYGVLAFLIVTDGRNADTINVSRRVKSSDYSGFPVPSVPRQWIPFASQVDLDNMNVKNVLGQLFADDEEFVAYDTLFRLFRWLPNENNERSDRKWVEYDGGNDLDFSMEAGRLMWIKTSEAKMFYYGSNTSASLIDDFTVTLPAKQWTDFVLPFRYDIHVGDLLSATGEPIELYKWAAQDRGRYSYITENLALLISPADSLRLLKGGEDAFTVFNPGDKEIVLRVPPRPASLSRYASSGAVLARRTGGEEDGGNGLWYYTIKAQTANSPILNDIMIGHNQTKRAFAVPPSFANESVVLLDANGKEMGHYFGPEIARGGTFTLRFYNDEKQRTTFNFSASQTGIVPTGTHITFVNAKTGEELVSGNSGYSVTVAGSSHQDVYMIVGNAGFRDRIGAGAPSVKFSVGAVMVNQAARSVRIKYYIPFAGVDRVEAAVYDLRGRQLWKNVERVRVSSWNTMEWRSRESKYGAAVAGMYIIRVRAIDARGRTVAVENRRITFAR